MQWLTTMEHYKTPNQASGTRLAVDLYLDVGSPYSWFALEVLDRYRTTWDLDLVLRPVLLGAIHHATGNAMPAIVRARGAHLLRDLHRSAVFFDLPWEGGPSSFGTPAFNTMNCQRLLTVVAMDKGGASVELLALARAMFSTIWRSAGQELDVRDAEFLKGCCSKAGFTQEETDVYYSRLQRDDTKAKLKETTTEAIQAGAYGTPSIVVRACQSEEHADLPNSWSSKPQLFFGSDRFEQLAFMFKKPWHGPCPTRSKL
ncbi:glutathione S-transferase kappa 1 [Klebsormidium nitens]|uniref:Glutathione S-transferase kappa 1 n=1 Tax=Klebsormidium nitens TaxID=105231 RepID=A0A1Y1HQH7_KLENI|nr:glutathione S-transferase kappa 1 [Klebsormidium nitens]|eukprot:GAQ80894.1 glutathione S-transferase kappa 1 [Klebsormidium nitens]